LDDDIGPARRASICQATSRRVLLTGGAALAAAGTARLAWRASKSPRIRALFGIPEPVLDIAALKPAEPPVLVPDAMLVDAAGTRHALSSFTGTGLVLNFWATWCAPCVAEMPALARLAGRVEGDPIMVLAAASDSGGAAAVSRFFAQHKIENLQIWLDPNGAAGRERARLEGSAHWDTDAAVAEIRRLAG